MLNNRWKIYEKATEWNVPWLILTVFYLNLIGIGILAEVVNYPPPSYEDAS